MAVWVNVSDQRSGSSKGVLGYGLQDTTSTVSLPFPDFSTVRELIRSIELQLEQTDVTEAEVTFGIQMNATGNVVVSQGQTDANLMFKLKWDRHS